MQQHLAIVANTKTEAIPKISLITELLLCSSKGYCISKIINKLDTKIKKNHAITKKIEKRQKGPLKKSISYMFIIPRLYASYVKEHRHFYFLFLRLKMRFHK